MKPRKRGRPMDDLTGQTFGRLLAITPEEDRRGGYVSWVCFCSCGGQVNVLAGNLKRGNTRSCGCLRQENMRRVRTDRTLAVIAAKARKDAQARRAA